MTLPDIGSFASNPASPGYSRANQRADEAIWDAAEARFERLALVQQRARDLAQSLAMCDRFGDPVVIPETDVEQMIGTLEDMVSMLRQRDVNTCFDEIARGDASWTI